MDALSVVSLEGNWDTAINTQRLDFAAAALRRSKGDFIISSGTCQPGSAAIDRARLKKLGERNAAALRDIYDIDSALIIPAYAFPFEFTYTTIEAFGNACVIGWLTSGLEKQQHAVRVDFAPISSGVHCRRVHVLNRRACCALAQFNVETIVKPQQLSSPDEPNVIESETNKLIELTRAGGVIATGRWLHGDEEWSFDDPQLMRAIMARLVKTVLPGSTGELIRRVSRTTFATRYATMQMLCEIAASRQLSSSALDRIFARTAWRFLDEFDEGSAAQIAKELALTLRQWRAMP